MKAYQHERVYTYEHPHSAFDFKSASLFQSLTTRGNDRHLRWVGRSVECCVVLSADFLARDRHGPRLSANADRHRSGDHRS
jgi:hypothetical protein